MCNEANAHSGRARGDRPRTGFLTPGYRCAFSSSDCQASSQDLEEIGQASKTGPAAGAQGLPRKARSNGRCRSGRFERLTRCDRFPGAHGSTRTTRNRAGLCSSERHDRQLCCRADEWVRGFGDQAAGNDGHLLPSDRSISWTRPHCGGSCCCSRIWEHRGPRRVSRGSGRGWRIVHK